MAHCDLTCPCQNEAAPKYPSGKIFRDGRGRSLMVVSKTGKFPDAFYIIEEVGTGKRSRHSYVALVRKELGLQKQIFENKK